MEVKDMAEKSLKAAIEEIVKEEGIKEGYLFDAHMVIGKLKDKYPKVYESNHRKGQKLNAYHLLISKMIEETKGVAVVKKEARRGKKAASWAASWSKDIKGRYSHCRLFIRLAAGQHDRCVRVIFED
ncbi:MAG: hypothetical protein MdMp014T_2736 [Treponematales bacterium]